MQENRFFFTKDQKSFQCHTKINLSSRNIFCALSKICSQKIILNAKNWFEKNCFFAQFVDLAILKRIAGQFSRLSVCLSVLHCSLDGHRKGLVLENEISFLACQIVFSIIVFRFHLLDQYVISRWNRTSISHCRGPSQEKILLARCLIFHFSHISPKKKMKEEISDRPLLRQAGMRNCMAIDIYKRSRSR